MGKPSGVDIRVWLASVIRHTLGSFKPGIYPEPYPRLKFVLVCLLFAWTALVSTALSAEGIQHTFEFLSDDFSTKHISGLLSVFNQGVDTVKLCLQALRIFLGIGAAGTYLHDLGASAKVENQRAGIGQFDFCPHIGITIPVSYKIDIPMFAAGRSKMPNTVGQYLGGIPLAVEFVLDALHDRVENNAVLLQF